MNYEAPTISSRQDLSGALDGFSQVKAVSDAEIKHHVEPVESTYQAPVISAQRDLDGQLQAQSDTF